MSQEEIKIAICKKALIATEEKIVKMPSALKGMYESIRNQLIFVIEYFEGKHSQHAKLHTLNFGVIAVREIEDTDPEYSKLLTTAFYVANRTAQGLKLDENFIKNHT